MIDPEDLAEAIDHRESLVEAIDLEDLAEAQQTVEAAIVRAAAAVETGVHLVVDLEDSADQAHEPAATEAPLAWDLAVVVVVAVEGGGKHGRQT